MQCMFSLQRLRTHHGGQLAVVLSHSMDEKLHNIIVSPAYDNIIAQYVNIAVSTETLKETYPMQA